MSTLVPAPLPTLVPTLLPSLGPAPIATAAGVRIMRLLRPVLSMTSPARHASKPAPTSAAHAGAGRVSEPARDRQLASWLAAAARGEAAAFERFYAATFGYARTVARRLLRDNAEIEDLLADCYFEAWRRAGQFDAARGSPVGWLLTLVRSRGLDALRAAAARPDRPGRPAAGVGGGDTDDTQDGPDPIALLPDPASETDPAERLWRRQASAELHAALATLSAAERWVLGLAYLRELSHAEIARCTGMPLGTIKSHAQRAQNKLRVLFAPGRSGPGRSDAGAKQDAS